MRFVFTIVLFIFILCVVTTITSFNEIPLDILANPFKVNQIRVICPTCLQMSNVVQRKSVSGRGEEKAEPEAGNKEYLSTQETTFSQAVSDDN